MDREDRMAAFGTAAPSTEAAPLGNHGRIFLTGHMLKTNMNIQLQWKFPKTRQRKRRRRLVKPLD